MNKLLTIRVIDTSGQQYRLLGFRSSRNENGGINVTSVTLWHEPTRQAVIVDNVHDLKKFSVIVE